MICSTCFKQVINSHDCRKILEGFSRLSADMIERGASIPSIHEYFPIDILLLNFDGTGQSLPCQCFDTETTRFQLSNALVRECYKDRIKIVDSINGGNRILNFFLQRDEVVLKPPKENRISCLVGGSSIRNVFEGDAFTLPVRNLFTSVKRSVINLFRNNAFLFRNEMQDIVNENVPESSKGAINTVINRRTGNAPYVEVSDETSAGFRLFGEPNIFHSPEKFASLRNSPGRFDASEHALPVFSKDVENRSYYVDVYFVSADGRKLSRTYLLVPNQKMDIGIDTKIDHIILKYVVKYYQKEHAETVLFDRNVSSYPVRPRPSFEGLSGFLKESGFKEEFLEEIMYIINTAQLSA